MNLRPAPVTLALTVGLAVTAVSFGSILIKWNTEAPPLTIAFYRMLWASVLLFPFYLRERLNPSRAEQVRPPATYIFLAGTSLALHFAFWITSLRYASVAVSVVLVNTAPLMVALISFLLWRERLTSRGAMGMVLALAGTAWLGHAQFGSPGAWAGAIFALLGALFLAFYLTAGHASLQTTHLWLYVYPTYSFSALLLGGLAWISKSPLTGFEARTHLLMFLLGLVPQCLGHTAYNRVLQSLSPTLVSMLVLGEPLGASLLAYLLLGENPGLSALSGGGAVIAGVWLVSAGGIRRLPVQPVAVGVIRSPAGFLVQRRRGDRLLEGLWEFPGGKIEAGESPVEAAVREIREEIGWQLRITGGTEIWRQLHTYSDRRVDIHFVLFEVPESDLPEGLAWKKEADLIEAAFPPANREVLRQLKESGTTRAPESEAEPE